MYSPLSRARYLSSCRFRRFARTYASFLRSDSQEPFRVHRQSWNYGCKSGLGLNVAPRGHHRCIPHGQQLPMGAAPSFGARDQTGRHWLRRVGCKDGPGSCLEVRAAIGAASKSVPRARAPARRTVCRHGRGMMAGPACTVPPTGPRFGARMTVVKMSASSPTAGASRNGFHHWSAN